MARNVTEIPRPNDVPDKIGKYVIINKVGKGSTGDVFLSHDPYYRRDVAIKVYNIEEDSDAERARVSRKMFFNEAHMVGMLQHPNIMPIYDAGEEDGKYYVVTEHIQGARTLAAYCRPDNLLRVDDVVAGSIAHRNDPSVPWRSTRWRHRIWPTKLVAPNTITSWGLFASGVMAAG